jgi:hypothetical protein
MPDNAGTLCGLEEGNAIARVLNTQKSCASHLAYDVGKRTGDRMLF